MIVVVADTNILISAVLFGGIPNRFIELAFAGEFSLAISPVLLEELAEVLHRKNAASLYQVRAFQEDLFHRAKLITPHIMLSIVKDDPDDDRVLECAVAAQANFIVTGDRHLLRLGSYKGITILTVRHFLDRLAPSASIKP